MILSHASLLANGEWIFFLGLGCILCSINAIKQNNNWGAEALQVLPLNDWALWKSCMLSCRCRYRMHVKVAAPWCCWHCHTTLTKPRLALYSFPIPNLQVNLFSIGLLGGQELYWWKDLSPGSELEMLFLVDCGAGCVTYQPWAELWAEPAEQVDSLYLEIKLFRCVYAHLLPPGTQ